MEIFVYFSSEMVFQHAPANENRTLLDDQPPYNPVWAGRDCAFITRLRELQEGVLNGKLTHEEFNEVLTQFSSSTNLKVGSSAALLYVAPSTGQRSAEWLRQWLFPAPALEQESVVKEIEGEHLILLKRRKLENLSWRAWCRLMWSRVPTPWWRIFTSAAWFNIAAPRSIPFEKQVVDFTTPELIQKLDDALVRCDGGMASMIARELAKRKASISAHVMSQPVPTKSIPPSNERGKLWYK